MYEKEFQTRLTQLRENKGVSARDMSLSIGQNPGYINNIETGKAFPSMSGFFYICEFLKLTPKDFFDTEAKNPERLTALISDLKKLDDKQLESVASIVRELTKQK
jgi:transcriptional regulator with XRE-family HTH domain